MISKIIIIFILCLLPITAWSAFPTTAILDDFNRTNEGPPMTGWADFANGFKVLSNQMAGNAAAQNTSYLNSFSYGPDVEAYATMEVLPGAGVAFQIFVANTSFNGYLTSANTTGDYAIYRLDGGTATSIKDGTHTWTAGDSLGMTVSAAGVASIYYKTGAGAWTLLDSIADGTYTNITNYALGSTCYDTTFRADNFGGGNTVNRRRSGQLIGG